MNRNLIAVSFLFVPAIGLFAKNGVKKKDTRPNIVYILADDLGIGDLGCYGQKDIKTPNIDRLAEEGMLFANHYAGSTVSAPSRCSLLTGKHMGHAYIRGNMGSPENEVQGYDYPLDANEVTVTDLLKGKRYVTACIGKWGLGGPGSVEDPLRHGFDYFFGYLGQANAHKYYPDFLWENEKRVNLQKKVYSHDMIVEKALDFIEENASTPFFLYFTPTLPHAELIVPEGELGEYDGKFQEAPFPGGGGYCAQAKPRATYAAMVSRLDRAVGLIVDRLEKKGVLGNTIIMFASDNGVHKEGGHDPEYFNSNGDFRGIKRDLYEGGIHTPYIIRWDSVVAKGTVSKHVSAFWDFLPTVADIVGIKPLKDCDGLSLLPTLTGKGIQKQHPYVYHESYEQGRKQSVIKGNWKLVRLNMNHPDKTIEELYNLDNDISEQENLAAQYPEKVKELRKLAFSAHQPSVIFK